jgi:hypothetical protein
MPSKSKDVGFGFLFLSLFVCPLIVAVLGETYGYQLQNGGFFKKEGVDLPPTTAVVPPAKNPDETGSGASQPPPPKGGIELTSKQEVDLNQADRMKAVNDEMDILNKGK